jgi:hypothetical protein
MNTNNKFSLFIEETAEKEKTKKIKSVFHRHILATGKRLTKSSKLHNFMPPIIIENGKFQYDAMYGSYTKLVNGGNSQFYKVQKNTESKSFYDSIKAKDKDLWRRSRFGVFRDKPRAQNGSQTFKDAWFWHVDNVLCVVKLVECGAYDSKTDEKYMTSRYQYYWHETS